MLKLAQENNIKVIGIRYTVDANYLAQISEDDKARVDDLSNSMDFTQILDYTNLTTDPKHFADPDHMNTLGRKLLLEHLRKDSGIDF